MPVTVNPYTKPRSILLSTKWRNNGSSKPAATDFNRMNHSINWKAVNLSTRRETEVNWHSQARLPSIQQRAVQFPRPGTSDIVNLIVDTILLCWNNKRIKGITSEVAMASNRETKCLKNCFPKDYKNTWHLVRKTTHRKCANNFLNQYQFWM